MPDSRVQLQGRITTTALPPPYFYPNVLYQPRYQGRPPSAPQPGFRDCLNTTSACIAVDSNSSHVAPHGGELPGYGGVGQYVLRSAAPARPG